MPEEIDRIDVFGSNIAVTLDDLQLMLQPRVTLAMTLWITAFTSI